MQENTKNMDHYLLTSQVMLEGEEISALSKKFQATSYAGHVPGGHEWRYLIHIQRPLEEDDLGFLRQKKMRLLLNETQKKTLAGRINLSRFLDVLDFQSENAFESGSGLGKGFWSFLNSYFKGSC